MTDLDVLNHTIEMAKSQAFYEGKNYVFEKFLASYRKHEKEWTWEERRAACTLFTDFAMLDREEKEKQGCLD